MKSICLNLIFLFCSILCASDVRLKNDFTKNAEGWSSPKYWNGVLTHQQGAMLLKAENKNGKNDKTGRSRRGKKKESGKIGFETTADFSPEKYMEMYPGRMSEQNTEINFETIYNVNYISNLKSQMKLSSLNNSLINTNNNINNNRCILLTR